MITNPLFRAHAASLRHDRCRSECGVRLAPLAAPLFLRHLQSRRRWRLAASQPTNNPIPVPPSTTKTKAHACFVKRKPSAHHRGNSETVSDKRRRVVQCLAVGTCCQERQFKHCNRTYQHKETGCENSRGEQWDQHVNENAESACTENSNSGFETRINLFDKRVSLLTQ